jgi:phosphoribosylanthranilate isomerase
MDTAPAARLPAGLIQVAGVIDREEARLLIACGVTHLGFPLRLDVHAEDLSEAEAAAIIRSLRPPHHGVLITYLTEAAAILRLAGGLGARIVQLHGPIAAAEVETLRRCDPDLTILRSLVVGRPGETQKELRQTVERCSPWVDGFLTDSHDPRSGASGATGRTHDWAVSRDLVELSPRPLILAGGLRADNVREAILTVRPAGVDVHTGVEGTDGRKDRKLVDSFVQEARAGFRELASGS